MPDKAEGDKSTAPNVSRLQKMQNDLGDQNYQPPMPACDAPYLIEYLYEIGPAGSSGWGSSAITPLEILGWANLIGIELQPWEARILRRLSIAYCNETKNAQKPEAESPWADAPHVKPARELLVARLKAAF